MFDNGEDDDEGTGIDIIIPTINIPWDVFAAAAQIYADTIEHEMLSRMGAHANQSAVAQTAIAQARALAGTLQFLKAELTEEEPSGIEVPPAPSENN